MGLSCHKVEEKAIKYSLMSENQPQLPVEYHTTSR